MLGERVMEKSKNIEWLEKFKIAIVREDFSLIEKLSSAIPTFDEVESMIKSQYLIKESLILLYREKQKTAEQMQKVRVNRAFVASNGDREVGSYFNHSY
jgi:dephospho-CoA kinase